MRLCAIDSCWDGYLRPESSALEIAGVVGFQHPSHFAKVCKATEESVAAEWQRNR
jgi:AraC-like DNA-binding protein